MKRIICFFLGHKDAVDKALNLPIGNPSICIVYSYKCIRCGRKREYYR